MGFLMGIAFYKERDMLIAIAVGILITYMAFSFYLTKLIEKATLNPAIYPVFSLLFFAFLTWYFYKKP